MASRTREALPDEIQQLVDGQRDEGTKPDAARLDTIGKALQTKKTEAITYRKMSGIEDTWSYCEDAYAGIDDANRHEFTGGRMVKALTLGAPLTTDMQKRENKDRKSTAFVRLTSRYVDSGFAKVSEILLPIDDKAFSFTATPVPDLIHGLNDHSQVTDQIHGQTVGLQRPARKEEVQNGSPEQVPLTTHDLAQEKIDRANEAAKKAEMRIFDWQVECQHPREMRKVIFDAARLGVGVVKGPFPQHRRSIVRTKGQDGKATVEIKQELVPVNKWISPWNFYPDPACGENIHNGDHAFERDDISEKQVRDLKGLPGYLDEQIDKAIEAGPTKTKTPSRNPTDNVHGENKHPYEIWFYHGSLKREDFEALNPKAAETLKKDQTLVYAIVTMIGEIVVRASINPLDSGELPYDAIPWVRRPGFWAGVGVGEQIIVPQRTVNASFRAWLNNAGITAGPQIVINKKLVTPAIPGDYTIIPNKVWYLTDEGLMDDVRKAFLSFDIHNTGKELKELFETAMRLAEESTNIPLITQGLSGTTTPDTLGATQLQNNNANQLLRSIGYGFDDHHTVPMTHRYYEYLLLDPNVPEEEKGDWTIHAHGSVSLVERSIHDQFIAQLTPIALNPASGINPKKWATEMLKSKHIDPTTIMFTAEELQKMASQPPQPAPAVQVAMIRAKTEEMKLQAKMKQDQDDAALERELAQLDAQTTMAGEKLRNETAQLKVKLDTDRDTAFVQAEMDRAKAEYTHNMELLKLKREIAEADYASKHQISLEQAKVKLADTSLKLSAQKELAAMDTHTQLHMHHHPSGDSLMKPPAQAPGKAPNGKAFSQV